MKQKPYKPMPDHPYHGFSDNVLRFIIQDASIAAKLMQNVDARAEAKYLDQVNDCATILAYRRQLDNYLSGN